MFEQFTDGARKAMALANQEAIRLNHPYINTEDILLGIVNDDAGAGATILKNHGIDLNKVRLEIERLVTSGTEMVPSTLPPTPQAKKAIEYAIKEARGAGHNYVGTEHLVLGLLRVNDSLAAIVLSGLGLDLEQTRKEVMRGLPPIVPG